MEGQDEQKRKSPRRSAGMFVLYVLLTAAAGVAAWQVREFLDRSSSRGASTTALPTGALTQDSSSQPAEGAKDWLRNPLSTLPLRPLERDPGDIAPPPGATRLSAEGGVVAGQLVAHARYRYEGMMDDAAEHYRRALERGGFKLLRDASGPGQRRELIGFRQGQSVNVTLRKPSPNARIVSVVLIVTRPEGEPASREK